MADPGKSDSKLAGELLEAFSRFDRATHSNRFAAMKQLTKPGQVFVLMNIKKQGPKDGSGLRVSEIAGFLGVTPSSITQIVTDLEAKGLVERKMDKADRRAVRVCLTHAGENFVEDFQRPYLPVMDEFVRSFGEDKSRTLLALLSEVNDFFQGRVKALREGPAAGPAQNDKERIER